jgi:MerR family redox-sensitive transcriptional activator SoxR
LKIGQIARQAGVATSAIRYYERIGLLPAPERKAGRRVYTEQAVDRLAVIAYARACGFRLDEVRALFEPAEAGQRSAGLWTPLAQAKIAELLDREAELRAMRKLLENALACRCLGFEECGAQLRRHMEKRKSEHRGDRSHRKQTRKSTR